MYADSELAIYFSCIYFSFRYILLLTNFDNHPNYIRGMMFVFRRLADSVRERHVKFSIDFKKRIVAKRQIIILHIILFSISCKSQSNDLIGKKWVKQGELCYDSLILTSGKNYNEYYCDTDNLVTGTYKVKYDTLTLTAYQRVKDVLYELPSEIKSNPDDIIPTYVTKYLKDNQHNLRSIYFEDYITGHKQILVDETWIYYEIE